jgi:hypothetical protein
MLLTTGKRITRCKFIEMPMMEDVAKQIKNQEVKDHAQKRLTFKNRNGEDMNSVKTTTRIHQLHAPKKRLS